jgi:hypothetical protein
LTVPVTVAKSTRRFSSPPRLAGVSSRGTIAHNFVTAGNMIAVSERLSEPRQERAALAPVQGRDVREKLVKLVN